ncbi:antibiotic biosynthesis monooxygenase [Streptomyces sp. NPDC005708]|uniref:putative quinol monooxygenase n=1 Tax=Streptomyces sp. NPDC005708 TaxID=3154564 RepID=UPI0033FE78D6
MSQVAQIACFVAKDGARDRLLSAVDDAVASAVTEPGTLAYVSHVEQGAPRTVWIYELYANEEARIAHGESAATARLRGVLAEVLDRPPTVTRADARNPFHGES